MRLSQLGWITLQVAIVGGPLWWYYAVPSTQTVGPQVPLLIGVGLALFLTAVASTIILWWRRASWQRITFWLGFQVILSVGGYIAAIVADRPYAWSALVLAEIPAFFIFFFVGAAGVFRRSPADGR